MFLVGLPASVLAAVAIIEQRMFDGVQGLYTHDSVTCDDTGCTKQNPSFFAFNKGRQSAHGFRQSEILHVAQSLFHDHAPAKRLGLSTVWIDRRHDRPGFGATPPADAKPDATFPDMASFAEAATRSPGTATRF